MKTPERAPLQNAYGILAGAGIAIVSQLPAAPIDRPLWVCIASFALAIPFLSILWFAPRPFETPPTSLAAGPQTVHATIEQLAPWLAVLGLTAFFWHFAWFIGVAFGISAFCAYRVLLWWASSPDYFTEPRP